MFGAVQNTFRTCSKGRERGRIRVSYCHGCFCEFSVHVVLFFVLFSSFTSGLFSTRSGQVREGERGAGYALLTALLVLVGFLSMLF